METLTAFLSPCPVRRRVVYGPQLSASGTKSIYVTTCVPVWRRTHYPTRPGPGRAAEPRADQRCTTKRASRSGRLRGALLAFGPSFGGSAGLRSAATSMMILDELSLGSRQSTIRRITST